jgi:hypothetical protein
MSLAMRQQVVSKLVFQDATQKSDLLDINTTNSALIAFLHYMTCTLAYNIEVTAVYTDHHIDGDGPGLHRPAGCAVDCWPLNSSKPGDYMDENSPNFQRFLKDGSHGPFYYDTGLGGSSYTPANMEAAGPAAFQDAPVDHVHFGVRPA